MCFHQEIRKKKHLLLLKQEIVNKQCLLDTPTRTKMQQTDGWMDIRTDRQCENSIPHTNTVSGAMTNSQQTDPAFRCLITKTCLFKYTENFTNKK